MYTILVAEDYAAPRRLLHDTLKGEAGLIVVAMPDGAALLRTSLTVLPDLVILDLTMPGLDGVETYELLRQRELTRNVPILFVTENPGLLRRIKMHGPCATLLKPFEVGALIARVSDLLGCTRPMQYGAA